jgi:hypothetical protein
LGLDSGTLMFSLPQAAVSVVATTAAAAMKRTLTGRLIEGEIIIASP